MTAYTTRPLSPETWDDFARLVEANRGVWGGCWCMGYHPEGIGKHKTVAQNRAEKEAHVRAGTARAALVYDGPDCVGWVQFGSPAELPRIQNLKAYLASDPVLPEWRIACTFTGKGHRRKGVAEAGLIGALEQIAGLGGGRVEAYPEECGERKVGAAFLFHGAMAMFARHGFVPLRQIGKHRWVVERIVAPHTL
jgi:hypothetical protein